MVRIVLVILSALVTYGVFGLLLALMLTGRLQPRHAPRHAPVPSEQPSFLRRWLDKHRIDPAEKEATDDLKRMRAELLSDSTQSTPKAR